MSTSPRHHFVCAVLDLYLRLPHSAARRPSRNDRSLAGQLFDRGIPLPIIRAAMLLAVARRSHRPTHAPPLPPIRSLYYFAPVIDDLLTASDPTFIDHINSHLQHLFTRPNRPDGQKTTLSNGR